MRAAAVIDAVAPNAMLLAAGATPVGAVMLLEPPNATPDVAGVMLAGAVIEPAPEKATAAVPDAWGIELIAPVCPNTTPVVDGVTNVGAVIEPVPAKETPDPVIASCDAAVTAAVPEKLTPDAPDAMLVGAVMAPVPEKLTPVVAAETCGGAVIAPDAPNATPDDAGAMTAPTTVPPKKLSSVGVSPEGAFRPISPAAVNVLSVTVPTVAHAPECLMNAVRTWPMRWNPTESPTDGAARVPDAIDVPEGSFSISHAPEKPMRKP